MRLARCHVAQRQVPLSRYHVPRAPRLPFFCVPPTASEVQCEGHVRRGGVYAKRRHEMVLHAKVWR